MFQEFKELVESCTSSYDSNDFLHGEDLKYVRRQTDDGDYESIDPEALSYTVEVVDEWGGMDEGTHIGAVYKLTDKETGETTHAEVYGSYYSHDGSYFEGVAEVEPFEKTVTRYKKKGS